MNTGVRTVNVGTGRGIEITCVHCGNLPVRFDQMQERQGEPIIIRATCACGRVWRMLLVNLPSASERL